ncbi:hypothetical protein ABWH96_13390 [Marivirga tractuosa]|uniref:hypothetical protein n=1 Tax=Marivirga tractuosa TaxID=1006 RepID=UPI0035D0A3A2
MEKEKKYKVEITPEAKFYYFELLEYLYKTHSPEKADMKSIEIMNLVYTLDKNPSRGRIESKLNFHEIEHRFILYKITNRKEVKIIYTVNENQKKVIVTDFFGTEMDDKKIEKRNF